MLRCWLFQHKSHPMWIVRESDKITKLRHERNEIFLVLSWKKKILVFRLIESSYPMVQITMCQHCLGSDLVQRGQQTITGNKFINAYLRQQDNCWNRGVLRFGLNGKLIERNITVFQNAWSALYGHHGSICLQSTVLQMNAHVLRSMFLS